jgi:hypothetical protein
VFHTLFGKLETSSALEVRLCASLLAENGAKPAGRKGSRLDVFVLAGDPDMLHGTNVVRDVLVDGVNRLVAILGGNVLGGRTHLYEGLKVDLDHWIKSWT